MTFESISAHSNRISLILYNPLIKNLLLSSSPERDSASTLKLWDVARKECLLTIKLTEAVMAIAF